MQTETHRIGWVAAVDSERLIIELDPATTGLVKGGIFGVLPVGSINSYVTIPAGPTRIVAVITAIRLSEEPPKGQEVYAAQESLSRRLEAVMVGRLEGTDYKPGIATYPALFSPVASATPDEVEKIFYPGEGPSLSLGEAVVAPDIDVRLDANLLLSRHSAVLGSTGSGKSCTVTAIVDALLELKVPNANIIIFDSNGEYAAAFEKGSPRGELANALVIGPETGEGGGLFLPHWFMDNEDHLDLFRAGEGAQAPLLQRAIADARVGQIENQSFLTLLMNVRRVCDDAQSILLNPGQKPQANLSALFNGLATQLGQLASQAEGDAATFWSELSTEVQGHHLGLNANSWDPLSLNQRQAITELTEAIRAKTQEAFDQLGMGTQATASDFDAPRYYSLSDLNDMYLPYRIAIESAQEPRIKGYAATLMMRLSRMLADARYNFMTRVPQHPDALARYLRLLTGADPLRDCDAESRPPWADTYEARTEGQPSSHSVTILDLSQIASDVLENTTALLGRLIMDFTQRVRPRGTVPILLVLEEAHRYIPHAERTRARAVFERIAKEGRKFGVGLMLASQRPSELARTVLAQCGTLVGHRTVNPEDQDLIRHATPFANREVLRQLPGLATQHAIVLGESAPVPSYVRIRTVENPPMSRDPNFIAEWQKEPEDSDLIESIASAWEKGETAPTPAPTSGATPVESEPTQAAE